METKSKTILGLAILGIILTLVGIFQAQKDVYNINLTQQEKNNAISFWRKISWAGIILLSIVVIMLFINL